MLVEISSARTKDGDRDRRWFTCHVFDLYTWETAAGSVEKFQICYKGRISATPGDGAEEDILTWDLEFGFRFDHIEAERGFSTPILRETGTFDVSEIKYEFEYRASGIDDETLNFVASKISTLPT